MPAYEADLERFKGYDAQVLGISVDSVPCNTAWAKSLGGLSYDLLSDFEPKGEVARKFGAYRQSDGISERALFIVDKEGKIAFKDIHDISDQPDNEDCSKFFASCSKRQMPDDGYRRGQHLASLFLQVYVDYRDAPCCINSP